MSEKPLISVIIPIYNIEDCLERCVRSVLNQTYSNLEILLVDDGSTDRTPELVDRLAREDERIRAFHKQNGGSSSARNYGIREAAGEYLGFVDSDDYIEPDLYELLMELIERYQVEVAQISRDEVNEDGSKRADVCVPPEDIRFCSSEEFLKELLLHKGDCSFCTKLLKRELFDAGGFPEGELNEDFRLFTEMLPRIKGVVIHPKQGYHVYYRIGSNTRRKDANDFSRVYTDIVVNADRIAKLVQDHYPMLSEYSTRFGLYQRLDYLLHIPILQMTKDNEVYRSVCGYLRGHRREICSNPYLTGKQKLYLLLFSVAPKLLRRAHRITMRLRGIV